MSEESPERVEEQAEEPVAKKKTTRKRAKPPEDSVVEKAEGKSDAGATSDVSPKSEPEPEPVASEETPERKMEDGETPTENPSVRRISSKRKSAPERTDGEAPAEQVATIEEPPAADGQGKKRRRRRRKGGASNEDEDGGGDDNRQPPRTRERINLDPEQVTKKAWKIFLSEVSEEGLALVSDQDAKEIGRRSFRLAEIFLEEASRRQ